MSEVCKFLVEIFWDLVSCIEYDELDKYLFVVEYFFEDFKKMFVLWVYCKINGLYLLEDYCVIEGIEEDVVVY